MRTHYQNLRVAENAEAEVIKAAYKALAQKWHPDRNPGDKEKAERYFKIIAQAYEVLSNPTTRKEYDDYLIDERLHRATTEEDSPKKSHRTQHKQQPPVNESLMLSGKTLKVAAVKLTAASLVIASLLSFVVFKLAVLGNSWAIISTIMLTTALIGNTLMILAGSYGYKMKPYKLLLLVSMPWLIVVGAAAIIAALPVFLYATNFLKEAFNEAPFVTIVSLFAILIVGYNVEEAIKKKAGR